MVLSELIDNLTDAKIYGRRDIEIENLETDSRCISKGSLFICLTGNAYDGHSFYRQAEKYGAVAILTEKKLNVSITQIIVSDTRKATSVIANNFYGKVSEKMNLIGVVGTNGKTTTAHMIGNILNNSGVKCGVIGTLGIYYGDKYFESNLTTPDPLILHKILSDMYLSGYKTAVMEVSAHALYYSKIFGLKFKVGVFTNFTRDHLDFFKDMDSYKKAKLQFFTDNYCDYLVVNADDDLGREISNLPKKIITYGLENPSDIFAIDIIEKSNLQTFVLNFFDQVYSVSMPLVGRFNLYNALGACSASALVGANSDKIIKALEKFTGAKGRMQCVYNKDFSVYIDYAHTPDGLEKVLKALKNKDKRLICVFGCGGNRDSGKRKEMGKISAKLSDFTIITSDNPRFEEPMEIISDIESGVLEVNKNYIIAERRYNAIEYALSMAKTGDIILVAGKGSEEYQEILGIKHPYNDKDTIEEILRRINH